MIIVFVIDFDGTISSKNTHNLITSGIEEDFSLALDMKKQEELFQTVPPVKSAEACKLVFETLLNDEHRVGIPSFNRYGRHNIPLYLNKVINLSNDRTQQVKIASWMPENPTAADKNLHIQNILEQMNLQESEVVVVLVDDNPQHIAAAQAKNYLTIQADTATGAHFEEILKLSKELKNNTSLSPEQLAASYNKPVFSSPSSNFRQPFIANDPPPIIKLPAHIEKKFGKNPKAESPADSESLSHSSFTLMNNT